MIPLRLNRVNSAPGEVYGVIEEALRAHYAKPCAVEP
jgi:hypothetical protein